MEKTIYLITITMKSKFVADIEIQSEKLSGVFSVRTKFELKNLSNRIEKTKQKFLSIKIWK